MNSHSFREIQPNERELIRTLLSQQFPGRDEVFEQLTTATARTIDQDGSLEFSISSLVKAERVKYVVPVEGEYEDPDGVTVHMLLHMSGDKVKELELFREDGIQVVSMPSSTSPLRVFAPQ